MIRLRLILALLLLAPSVGLATPKVVLEDPFDSGMWEYHQENLLGDPDRIVFDDRIRLVAPDSAEDSFNVPVMVDATALEGVEEIVISADYSPIPKILSYFPGEAQAKLAFRFKIDQGTVIRAAVRLKDDSWRVWGTYIDAAGGGCTAPAAAYASDDWEERLGEIHGRLWTSTGRARMVLDHPMDTGLADGIPVFILRDLNISDDAGQELARLRLHEPINEDPAFTLYFDPATMPGTLHVNGRDNNGNMFSGVLESGEIY